MSKAGNLLKSLKEKKQPIQDMSEKINRIPVKKAADMSKVLKMAQNLPKNFEDQWKALKEEKQKMADLLWSMNHSFREIRLFLEDNFTLDPKNMEGLPPEAKSLINELESKADNLDRELSGMGSAISGASTAMGTGALRRQFKGLEKEMKEMEQLIKDFMKMAKKEKIK